MHIHSLINKNSCISSTIKWSFLFCSQMRCSCQIHELPNSCTCLLNGQFIKGEGCGFWSKHWIYKFMYSKRGLRCPFMGLCISQVHACLREMLWPFNYSWTSRRNQEGMHGKGRWTWPFDYALNLRFTFVNDHIYVRH